MATLRIRVEDWIRDELNEKAAVQSLSLREYERTLAIEAIITISERRMDLVGELPQESLRTIDRQKLSLPLPVPDRAMPEVANNLGAEVWFPRTGNAKFSIASRVACNRPGWKAETDVD